MTAGEIGEIVRIGSRNLFAQFQRSNGFPSVGDAELAEAALVVHVSAVFLALNHCVWPESPFRNSTRGGRTNHPDLLIDLNPEEYENPHALTVEAKAVAPGHEKGKILEIVSDHARICDWALHDPSGRPLVYVVSTGRNTRSAAGPHHGRIRRFADSCSPLLSVVGGSEQSAPGYSCTIRRSCERFCYLLYSRASSRVHT
jgi:hypothetical protein